MNILNDLLKYSGIAKYKNQWGTVTLPFMYLDRESCICVNIFINFIIGIFDLYNNINTIKLN